MAKPRKLWTQLTQATRLRKLRHYRKQGLTDRQIASRYNTGKLGSQKAARGHAQTPEHGMKEALKEHRRSGKYDKYIDRRNTPRGGDEIDQAISFNQILDLAYASMQRLADYVYYNEATVRANVYGGETSESGPVPGMSLSEATWTGSATVEEIRYFASPQYTGNPWWYH